MYKLQKKDILLITYLRNNARENLTKISRLTHIPVSTIFDRLKELETDLISKHTTLVNFKKLGFDIKINILFKVERNSREEFKEYLIKNQNINSVFRVNNGFDFLLYKLEQFRIIISLVLSACNPNNRCGHAFQGIPD